MTSNVEQKNNNLEHSFIAKFKTQHDTINSHMNTMNTLSCKQQMHAIGQLLERVELSIDCFTCRHPTSSTIVLLWTVNLLLAIALYSYAKGLPFI